MTSIAQAGTVSLFGTCLADAVYPEAGVCAVRLIERLGKRVVYPLDQGCCGQPAYNSGFPEQARAVAVKQIDAFSRVDGPIVVPSGSCAGMLRHHYPKLFEGHPRYFDAVRFSSRVLELFEYLDLIAPDGFDDRGPAATVTWHSSCHAQRETGSTKAAKSILAKMANVRLVELSREFECCGFGGTFAVKRPEVSEAMVRDKVEDIRATGATVLLTADCGCLMNIAGAAEKMGLPLKGMHLAQFLWERVHA